MKKRIILLIILIGFFPFIVEAKEYNNIKNNFKITVPETYYVIDETNIEENKEFIESYGITLESIREVFKDAKEVTIGIKSDDQVTMHIKVSENRNSQGVWDLNNADSKQLASLIQMIKNNYKAQEYKLISQEYIEPTDQNNIKFLKSVIEYTNGDYEINYHTVHNGKHYDMSFISYDINNQEEILAEIESIQGSFEFTKTLNKLLNKDKEFKIIILIIVGILSIIGIVYEVLRIKRKKI